MGAETVINNLINQQLMNMSTAYLAKVISVSGTTAKIQPLGKVKAYGETAKTQSVLSSVPITQSARYKVTLKNITYVCNADGDTRSENLAVLEPINAGDVVICVCCDRDITEAKKGNNSTPALGHHSKSDSVIVGIL